MRESFMNLIWAFAVVVGFVSAAQSSSDFSLKDFNTNAVFELVNHQSGVIRQGSTRIVAVSAFVTHTNELFPGKTEGLEIQFFTKPITEAARTDILENGAKQLTKSDYATLVLFLDKEKRVGQVNLSYVIPGTTVARTVAWKPEDLKRSFSNYQFDGKRLRLKSKGTFSELNSKQEAMSLSWDVDFDLPVFERARK
jgi:hypothetical protein